MIEKLSPTRRSARRLRYVTIAVAAVLAIVMLFAIWILISGRREAFTSLRIQDGGLSAWPAAILVLIIGALIVLALLRLARMLWRVEQGESFRAAGDLRRFALYLFLSVLFSVLGPPLVLLAFRQAAGDARPVELSISVNEVLMILVTGLLFFVARLLDEAQAVADDASQIV